MVGIHVQVDMYTERGGRDIIWGTHGEYLFTGGDVQSSMILDEWLKILTKKNPNDNHVSILFLYK